jgi:hypothetical protein
MYKFVARLEVTMPGQPPRTRKEEHIFGVSNAKLANMNFTSGFTHILCDKLEDEKWVNEFLTTGMDIQKKLDRYKKAKYKVKYEQVVEEVTEFK